MNPSLAEHWRVIFWSMVQQSDHGQTLKEASVNEHLGAWTKELTTVSVETCQGLGWQAAAKGHRLDLLPEAHSEYLGMDIMAFSDSAARWRFPIAVIELENSRKDDRIAYSLWKVLCVRAELRIVFCYRREPNEGADLVRRLSKEVVGAVSLDQRQRLDGETVVVVGSRGESATFPYGFFKWWRLEWNIGRFSLLG
jgi:hypothetical protein